MILCVVLGFAELSAPEQELQHAPQHDSVWSHLQNAILDVAAQGVNDAFVVSNEQQVVADCHCRAADTTE